MRRALEMLRAVRRAFVFPGLVLALLATGCAGRQKKTSPGPARPQLVGKVAVINEPLHFVLVEVGSLYSPAEGATLKCMAGAQETAVLSVSPERKRPFIVGDIVKGTPHRGDLVFQ